MNDLVDRLSVGSHPVELVLRPERTLQTLNDCLERRFVHVKFTETRGGTELGIQISDTVYQEAVAAIEAKDRPVHLAGDLVLDYVPVRCEAEVDIETWRGSGHLVKRNEDTT